MIQMLENRFGRMSTLKRDWISQLIRVNAITLLSLISIEMATGQSPPVVTQPTEATSPSSLASPSVADHTSTTLVNDPDNSAGKGSVASVVEATEASAGRSWEAMGIPLRSQGKVVAVYQDKVVQYEDRDSPWFDRSGFIHPMRTPSGKIVTDPFSSDHPHQHAIMFAWTSSTINGRKVDFWNSHRKQGRIEQARLIGHSENSVEALLDHVDVTEQTPVVTLREHWRLQTVEHPSVHVLDFESTQIKSRDVSFKVRQYHYGGLCVRGAAQWQDAFEMITSDGQAAEDGNHTQPRWVAMFGEVDGEICGIAAMDHPTNFRYPQHARLHPTFPYFAFFPAVDSGFEIQSDVPYRSRFRFVAFDGKPDVDVLNQLCDDFDQKTFEAKTADTALGIR